MHSRIAWFAAATHILASLAMLVLLRDGLPGFPEESRLAYMAAHPAAWTGGWMLWQLAAVSLLALYVVLALRFGGVASVLALVVAAAGFAIDLTSEVRYIDSLPALSGEAFVRLDRELEVLIGYAANGLYTLAFALLSFAGWRVLPRAARVLAVPVVASGVALAIASLLHDARAELVTSAVLFPLFTLWIVVVARWLRARE